MKNFYSITFLFFSIVQFLSCDGLENYGEECDTPDNSQLETKTCEIIFPTNGGSNLYSFTAAKEWSAEILDSYKGDWCTVFPTSGSAGDATITISTTPNDVSGERSAAIVIKAGTIIKIIKVSQRYEDILIVKPSRYEVDATGGEFKIEINSNIDFEYAIDETTRDWIKCSGTRGVESTILTFNVDKNDDINKREGNIAFFGEDLYEMVTISQSGSEPFIVASKNEYYISSNGGTIAVEMTSNVDVAIELPMGVDWISESAARGTSDKTYYFDIQPNESYGQRSAEIKFANNENGLVEVVIVVQTQKDVLIVAKENYTVSSEGGQIEVEVNSNVDFDIEISDDWIKHITTRSLQCEFLTFEILQNTRKNERCGLIKFISENGLIVRTVEINQFCDNGHIEDIENGDTNEW